MPKEEEIVAFDAEDLEDSDKLVLTLISKKKIMRTRLQKSALAYSKSFGTKLVNHVAYNFGGYSEDVDEALDTLEDIGAISEDRYGYFITEYGKMLIDHMKNEDEFKKMELGAENLVKALEKVSDRELVGLTYEIYPDYTKESTIKESVDRMNKRIIVNDKPLSEYTKESFEESIRNGTPINVEELR